MSMMVSFCAVLFPTRCLGWDLELNWVSFWGFSFLLFKIMYPCGEQSKILRRLYHMAIDNCYTLWYCLEASQKYSARIHNDALYHTFMASLWVMSDRVTFAPRLLTQNQRVGRKITRNWLNEVPDLIKTSSGKKDSTKRRHQRHHQRQPGILELKSNISDLVMQLYCCTYFSCCFSAPESH